MPFELACPGCQAALSLPVNTPGAIVICPHCRAEMYLPRDLPPLSQRVTEDSVGFIDPGFFREQKPVKRIGEGAIASLAAFGVTGAIVILLGVGLVDSFQQDNRQLVRPEKSKRVPQAQAKPASPDRPTPIRPIAPKRSQRPPT